jgi:hypothetical protein
MGPSIVEKWLTPARDKWPRSSSGPVGLRSSLGFQCAGDAAGRQRLLLGFGAGEGRELPRDHLRRISQNDVDRGVALLILLVAQATVIAPETGLLRRAA